MRPVNLLPVGERNVRRGPFTKKRLAIAGAVGAVGLMGYWGVSLQQRAGGLDRQISALEDEKASISARSARLASANKGWSEVQKRRLTTALIIQARPDWERAIRRVSGVMPSQIWLTSLKAAPPSGAQAPPAATPGKGTQIPAPDGGLALDGFAFTPKQVATAMSRLASLPGLGEPRLKVVERQIRGNRPVIHFTIDIPLDGTSAPADAATKVKP